MAIVLTAEDLIAVSRRIVKIPSENVGFSTASSNIAAAGVVFQNVDNGSKAFMSNWLNLIYRYMEERRNLIGQQYINYPNPPYAEVDVTNAAQDLAGNLFFPKENTFLIPLIDNHTDGSSTGTEVSYETFLMEDVVGISNVCLSGIAAGPANATLGAPYAGTTTLTLNGPAVVANGSYIIINGVNALGQPRDCLVRVVDSAATPSLTVRYICGNIAAAIVIAGSSVVINSAGSIWSNVVRKNLAIAATYPNTASGIVAYMNTASSSLLTLLVNQYNAIYANDDYRVIQKNQNTNAYLNAGYINTTVTTWRTLPPSDAGGNSRFNDAGLTLLRDGAVVRASQNTTRPTEIATALGSLSDGGSGTYSGSGALYINYQWLDRRINRQIGSLRKYYQQGQANTYVTNLIDTNDSFLDDSGGYLDAVKASLLSVDNQLVDYVTLSTTVDSHGLAIFSPGDTVYLIDETMVAADKITAIIQGIDYIGNTVHLNVTLNKILQTKQLARMYKAT